MRTKKVFLMCLAVGIFYFLFFANAYAYFLMLPIMPPSPPFPYTAEKDHYSGPACVQMILNSCPDIAERNFHSQDDIYSSILAHNIEPSIWFSDPKGIEGALEDSIFSPCGNWVDYSNTDKNYVLGKMLYYLKAQQYLTPVSVGENERWVVVFGYETDVEPSSPSSSVTLLNVFYYDPIPGSQAYGWKSGTAWLNTVDCWGVPLNKPGSSWHNKYIAVIEPPEVSIKVIVRRWVLKGRILPLERIEQYFRRWLNYVRQKELARGPFEILSKDVKAEKPILVKTPKYSYYLVPFKDRRLAAIFNAYDGSFEEFRYFQKPRRYTVDRKIIKNRLSDILRTYKAEVTEIQAPSPLYDPELALAGRFSPTWQVQAIVKDARGISHKLLISVDDAGKVVRGLKKIKEVLVPKRK